MSRHVPADREKRVGCHKRDRTIKLYDRQGDHVSLDEIERCDFP